MYRGTVCTCEVCVCVYMHTYACVNTSVPTIAIMSAHYIHSYFSE